MKKKSGVAADKRKIWRGSGQEEKLGVTADKNRVAQEELGGQRETPRRMGKKNKRGTRSEIRTQVRHERCRYRSRKRQLANTSKDIQEIREEIRKKIGEVKLEQKTETEKNDEQTVVDEFAFVDYGRDGDSGADATTSGSCDRADGETGAASAHIGSSAGPEHRTSEKTSGQRDGSRGVEKCGTPTRTTVEPKPRRW